MRRPVALSILLHVLVVLGLIGVVAHPKQRAHPPATIELIQDPDQPNVPPTPPVKAPAASRPAPQLPNVPAAPLAAPKAAKALPIPLSTPPQAVRSIPPLLASPHGVLPQPLHPAQRPTPEPPTVKTAAVAPMPASMPRSQAPSIPVETPAPPHEPASSAPAPSTPVEAKTSPDSQNLPPEYPLHAIDLHEEGQVVLQVSVGPDGLAQAIAVASSSGFVSLDQAAAQAVANWHFHAAMDDGVPVASQMTVVIRFVLHNGQAEVEP